MEKTDAMPKLYFLFILIILLSCNREESVKFAICTDVHHDLIHDATDRLSEFVKNAEEENVDFIIQLGDFCMPYEKNEPFMNVWNSFEGNRFHVLGNHDMDVSPKSFTQFFWEMNKPYYSFDSGDFHFIVLDPNFYKAGAKTFEYSEGNYFNYAEGRCVVPKGQIDWLKKDLMSTNKKTIVFSHQSLEHRGGIKNRMEVREVFAENNREEKKVIACICGHDHQDRHMEIDGIHYIGLNSMSYAWVGKEMEYSGRFPDSIELKYPNLKYTLPYHEPLWAIIEVKKDKLIINGIQSDFIKPGPEELGVHDHSYSAKISNRILMYKK